MAKAVEATQEEESKTSDENDAERVYDAIIVGAGAAGVGVAIALGHSGVENYLVVDRAKVG